MRDFLEGIIHDNRQLVGMETVGTTNHEITDLALDLCRALPIGVPKYVVSTVSFSPSMSESYVTSSE